VTETAVSQVWAFDEGRFGLRVRLGKRWCPCGVRPPWVVHDRYEWLWLYAAVEPATGQALFLLLPRVTKEWFAGFLDAFAQAVGNERVGLVLDGSGAHRADIPWPEHVVPLPLPRYSPELNPASETDQPHLRHPRRVGGGTHHPPAALLGAARLGPAPDRLSLVDPSPHLYVTCSVKEYKS
jgi:hypothetical protein